MTQRMIQRRDIPQTVRVMSLASASLAGLTTPALFRAICGDACIPSPRLVAIVSEDEGQIVGYAVAVIEGKRYWPSFACRHPLLASQIILKRVRKRIYQIYTKIAEMPHLILHPQNYHEQSSAKPQAQSSPASTRIHGRSWYDEGREIAKVLHIGVHPQARGQGVGRGMYRCLFDLLRLRNVVRVDATIDEHNYSSIRMHQCSGWLLVHARDHWFATIDL